MSSTAADDAKARAEARFKKRDEAQTAQAEGRQAAEAEQAAIAAKTARLRELRLAKEASERAGADITREPQAR